MDEIQTLLQAPTSGDGAPSLERVEHALTAGYGRALALDALRLRLQRRISAMAVKLENDENASAELAELGRRLSSADSDLVYLRGLLTSLRSRAEQIRAAA